VTVRSLAFRAALAAALFAAVVLLLSGLVPGAGHKLAEADAAWLVLAVALELVACAGYAALFHAVFARPPHELPARRSAQIALAELGGFAVVPAGVGGPAARIWGLRRAGMPWRTLGVRTVAHAPIFNAPYIAAALLLGLAVVAGFGPGHAPFLLALAPAGVVLAGVLAAVGLMAGAGRRRRRPEPAPGWRRTVRDVLRLVPAGIRETPALAADPRAVLGAVGYWAGDCAVLWAAFQAIGSSPSIGVIALGYMLGQLGNIVPLPGGVGGVESVMLGVFTASGVASSDAAAAIVCYRAIALGLQALLGALAVAALVPEIRGRPGGGRRSPKDRAAP
jgi:uncharacterized membrane protein YbhN (UPF0104 family)